ncbi:sterol uptake control protein 2 [Aspergillus udagawae]|nr:sterol uptake control protein 2 [Aspergillus udagawae]
MDIQVEAGSRTSPLPSDVEASNKAELPDRRRSQSAEQGKAMTNQRQKRPHTKSRWGCYNCRARRVKCQETKPACENCMYRDMECVYPSKVREWVGAGKQPASRRDALVASSQSGKQVSPSQGLAVIPFSGDDLRFFHHFLVVARPHLPFGSEGTWATEIPRYAPEYPHLMHAILALGATHYSLVSPNGSEYSSTAIIHRGKALKALSTAIGKGPECTTTDMDVILATCYALVFQAYHMQDGLVDFAVMVRGCGVITNCIMDKYKTSQLFHLSTAKEAVDVAMGLANEPLSSPLLIDSLLAAIDRLQPLFQSTIHHRFYRALRETLAALAVSDRTAFVSLTRIYAVWYEAENREFLMFIAPANHVSRALFMYFLVIECFMQPVYIVLHERSHMTSLTTDSVIHQWADAIYRQLQSSIRDLIELPMQIIAADENTKRSSRGTRSDSAIPDLHAQFVDLETIAWLGCPEPGWVRVLD